MSTDDRLSSPAALRNREPILAVLRDVLPSSGMVLEVASGSGEHAITFARGLPDLMWQPSDPSADARASISEWIAAEGLRNVLPPLDLNAAVEAWPIVHVAAMIAINMVHISPWAATLGLMRHAGRLLPAGAPLVLYGPFRQLGEELVPSNAAFDADLRARNSAWGIRSLNAVVGAADARDLRLHRTVAMPANNLSIVFIRN